MATNLNRMFTSDAAPQSRPGVRDARYRSAPVRPKNEWWWRAKEPDTVEPDHSGAGACAFKGMQGRNRLQRSSTARAPPSGRRAWSSRPNKSCVLRVAWLFGAPSLSFSFLGAMTEKLVRLPSHRIRIMRSCVRSMRDLPYAADFDVRMTEPGFNSTAVGGPPSCCGSFPLVRRGRGHCV